MDDLLASAAARAIRYLRERDDRPVFPSNEARVALQGFVERLPADGTEPDEVLRILDESGGLGTVATTGGRYFGFVTGGAHPAAVAASWLASAWDQNAGLGVMSPTAAVLDTIVGEWLVELFGLPADSQHQFVAGTSVANATCLAVARDQLLAEAGWDCVADGLIGAPRLRVVVSEAAHSSVTKALGFVGLGRNAVTTVPAVEQGRITVERLPDPGDPTLVVLQAGNVNSGASDSFGLVAEHYAGSPSWIHVDGAFGLWAAASPKHQLKVEGLDRADSWSTDMHKWLNVTYDSAVAIVRRREDLARTFQVGAAYLPDSTRLEPMHRGPDMSQRARAIETWAVLKSLGRSGVAQLVERSCDHARTLAAALESGGLVIHNDVVLNQILVGCNDDSKTEALVDAVQRDGRIWCGGSEWRGRPVMRISVSSWATTAEDIDVAAAAIMECAAAT